MKIDFRPAQLSDVSAAVPLIYSSGPAVFNYVFAHKSRGSAQDFLRHVFVDGAGEFGYRNHTVALIEERVVGIGAAFSGNTTMAFTLAAARQIFAFYGPLYAWKIIKQGLQVETVIKPPKKHEYALVHLGVTPEYQSQGIGAQLIGYLISQGQAVKRPVAVLDVAVTNPRAEALYARLGFSVTAERQSTLSNSFGKVVNHRRMEKSIS